MDRRSLARLLVGVLVVLSGCTWIDRPDPTPRPTSSVTPNGDPRPAERIQNHTVALADEGYELAIRVNSSTTRGRLNRTIHVTSDPATRRQRVIVDDRSGRSDRYLNGSTVYVETVVNGTRNYSAVSIDRFGGGFEALHRRALAPNRLAAVFGFARFEENGTATVDSRTVSTFRLTTPTVRPNVTVSSATGRLLIDRGVVYRATVELRGQQGDDPFFVHVDYRLLDRGSISVEPPTWLDRAPKPNATD